MRRGPTFLMAVAAVCCLAPNLLAQYPYPYMPPGYGRMPMQQMPGYGYPGAMMPQPMPYPQAAMPVRPVYYYPPAMQRPGAPMFGNQPTYTPKVYNYGPLPDESAPTIVTSPGSTAAPGVPGTPTSTASAKPLLNLFKTSTPVPPPTTEIVQEGCGPQGCGPGGCPPTGCVDGCAPVVAGCDACQKPQPRPHPRGHYVGYVGAYVFVPYRDSRAAYTSTTGGVTTTNNFGYDVTAGPRLAFGYIFHNGWGVRANGWYMNGDVNASASNSNLATTIATPIAAPFQITSPSATLAAGIGVDQFSFTQRFEMIVGDFEVVKEACCFDLSFLFGAGVRYSQVTQGYNATRINNGGINGATAVTQDQQDLSLTSVFQGLGPTVSMDVVQPIKGSCLGLYGNVRGAAIFGVERFYQELHNQNRTTTGGVTTFTDTTTTSRVTDNRVVPMVEFETGLQLGKRIGPCYVFGRAGVAYQRWWEVGSPIGSTGNLSFLGGTAVLGITY